MTTEDALRLVLETLAVRPTPTPSPVTVGLSADDRDFIMHAMQNLRDGLVGKAFEVDSVWMKHCDDQRKHAEESLRSYVARHNGLVSQINGILFGPEAKSSRSPIVKRLQQLIRDQLQ